MEVHSLSAEASYTEHRATLSMSRAPSISQPALVPAPASVLRATRYAVRYDPPCVFLEYMDSLDHKLRVRTVKLNLQAEADVDRLTRKVIRSFPRRLDPTSIKTEQVRKLVLKLVQHWQLLNGHSNGASSNSSSGRPGALPALCLPDGSSSKPSLRSPKASISPKVHVVSSSVPRRLLAHPGGVDPLASTDSRFSTSSQFDTQDPLDVPDWSTNSTNNPPGASASAGHPTATSSVNATVSVPQSAHSSTAPGLQQHAAGAIAKAPDKIEEDEDGDEALVLEIELPEDLNQVTELELKMAKARMDSDFQRNQVKPGDTRYEYNKVVEFQAATQENEWDE
mmetsp:Transcript_9248/g.16289  ORF Transcript_9248/g.16289 Transcript_9248/m.16289 type:complete len:338 (+) Transcript_9248:23-1036(+)|eukprot:CAMPEP_0119110638 /NCGR_PEP_ID=MMETSP1180-20130426/31095_1 /TAXON_ID=3052 ORGANISM="Chlamydomonas cf sp, Strain CCMP681" /NCGR_SAMPLE_ID=MMETSP1180 /ASSEMBLY_ACC=CAM_ASM_000741 /LENGTH=337 /DNA_ID=CAMNT_0007097103 /DNA_START=1 /DNA_END=1014 /DNA_ORIENTATION=+